MIKSMTGYGGAKGVCEGLGITIELKSVNNRYLDCSVRLPRNFLFCEETIKSLVGEHISRGKVDVFVTVDSTGAEDIVVTVNEALAKGYLDAFNAIAEKFSLPGEVSSVTVAKMPDVLSVEKKEADKDALSAGISNILAEALAVYDDMRAREGAKLHEDIASRLVTIENLVSEVEEKSPQTVEAYRERLYKKMTEVLSGATVDEQRILTEAAIFADKVAVDEETVRLRSHISQMREMLAGGSPIGRKMDFLIQEFNREANTIGSKCTNSEISKVVIEIKSEIEKIREQIQNIE
ncbi:MAG: YicC family protein [Oscillospiraceae bacterium]|nr:YicC family protein [Oscillospiraceae bacterium]